MSQKKIDDELERIKKLKDLLIFCESARIRITELVTEAKFELSYFQLSRLDEVEEITKKQIDQCRLYIARLRGE